MANDTTLDKVVIEFDGKVNNFDASIDTLIEKIKGLREQLKGMTEDTKDASSGLENAATKADKASRKISSASKQGNRKRNNKKSSKNTDGINSGIKALTSSLKSAKKTFVAFTGFSFSLEKMIELSTESIGVQTRFNSVFNNSKQELEDMQKWAKSYSDSLYLDKFQVMDAASNFKLLAGNIGLTNKQANKMSKELTMLSYDLKAVKGEMDVSMAQTALMSALGGEAEAMKRYGVMLNQATLQQTLYALGIDRTVASLNAAERAELIYYQIMTTTAGQHGYYAKTLMSPANALNIIRTQFKMLAREIGNVFIPLLMALTPIIINITQILRALAEALANVFGFKIAFNKYTTDVENITSGIDGIGDSADATSAKVKNMTRDFDKLHVINFDTPTGSGSGSGLGFGGASDLNLIDQANYNGLLTESKDKLEQIEKIVGFIKDHWLEIAGAIGGLSLFKFISSIGSANGKLGITKSLLGAIGFAATGIALTMEIKLIPKLVETGFSKEDNSFDLETYGKSLGISGLGGLGVAGIAKFFGATNPVTAIAGLITAAGVHSFNSGIAIGSEIKEIQKNVEVLQNIQKEIEAQEKNISNSRKAARDANFLNMFGQDEKYNNIYNSLVEIFGSGRGLNLFDISKALDWKEEIDELERKMKFEEGKKNVAQFVDTVGKNFKIMGHENGQKIEGLKNVFSNFVGKGKRLINELKDEMTSSSAKVEKTTTNMTTHILNSLGLVQEEGSSDIEILSNNITGAIEGLNGNTQSHFTEFKNRITSGFEKMKQDATSDMNNLNTSTVSVFDKMKTNSQKKLSLFVTDSLNKFKQLVTGTTEATSNLEKNTTGKFTDLGNKISNAFTNARTKASSEIEKIKDLTKFEWKLPTLKTPKFTWSTVATNVGSTIAQMLNAFNLPSVVPQLKIDWFANGGFPDTGSLFVANEREPELIGSWGNKSMVANSTQIIKGIESASYNGMKRALTEVPMSNETNVYVGNKQLTDVVTKQQRRNNNKYGR